MKNKHANTAEKSDFEMGHQLLESIDIPRNVLDMLFSALLLTSLCVYIGGNLLFHEKTAFLLSSLVSLPSFAALMIIYMISHYLSSIAWGVVLTYGLMSLVTYGRATSLNFLFYAIALLALIYSVRFIRVRYGLWPKLLLMAVTAAVTILFVTNAYTSFDMLARLYSGAVKQDTLFHASIAAMIKNYGITSTGLNGLVSTPYHVLSHILIASISGLSGVNVIEVYGVAPWVFFAPILIFGVVAVCCALDKNSSNSIPITWSTACFILAFFPFVLDRWIVWDSFFVSESYLTSLGLLLVATPILFKKRLTVFDCLLALALAVLISYAKASVGLVYVGLWFARAIIIQRMISKIDLILSILIACIASITVLGAAEASASAIGVAPFDFIYNYTRDGQCLVSNCDTYSSAMQRWNPRIAKGTIIFVFMLMHFLPTWIFTSYVLINNGFRRAWRQPATIYCVSSFIAGMAIVAIFQIPGGAVYYFTNVAFFVALPLVVGIAAHHFNSLRFTHWPILVLILASVSWVKNHERPGIFWPNAVAIQKNRLVDELLQARTDSLRNAVLKPSKELPTDNPITICWGQPFIYPAVSERPWTNVVDFTKKCKYKYYGYESYGITDTKQKITNRPKLMQGMQIISWPPEP